MEESTSVSEDHVMAGDDGKSEVKGEVVQNVPKLVFKPSHEAKLRELLHKICSVEIKLCSDATKEFVKLLKGETGGKLLHLYVQNSSKFTELLEAWKLRQGKQGLLYIFSLISAILSHPDGKSKGSSTSRAVDKFARLLVEEKLDEIYKELNSKEGKRQNAALMLLTSIVRRGPGLASDVAKKFDFKIQGFPKLAVYKVKRADKARKHSTRKAFVGFAMSFLEVGKPGLLRWVLQQKEMYSGVLRGLGNDEDEAIIYVLSTLRDRILVEESLVPPGLRSALFGSVALEQLVGISGREDGGSAAELAHNVLVMVCTDPCNGLMPDLKRPNPLRGNPKRLLMVMKKLRATEVGYHRDLLMAIVRGRPSLASAFLDEFPYNVEDCASPTWFSSVSLAANLVSSVGISSSFDFLDSHSHDVPSFDISDVQNIMKCICPRPFSRSVINKGLLHCEFLVKHGTLRLLLETLKLLDSFVTALNRCSSSSQMTQSWASLEQEIQNEARNFLPDSQVLLTLVSSLSGNNKSQNPSMKRKEELENGLEHRTEGNKKSKKGVMDEDTDIVIAGLSSNPDITLPEDGKTVVDAHIIDELDAEKEFLAIVSEIWASELCSKPINSLEDAEIYFRMKLLDALRIYLRTIQNVLEGSFEFFMSLLSNPLKLPPDLLRSLLSLLNEYICWCPWSLGNKIPIRSLPFMYKHLHPFINLLLFSPHSDIKALAYDLAQAAMFSTGAFDKNPNEIGGWFLFLPGYEKDKFPAVVQQAVQSLSSAIISFLCDAVSTVGNNFFKYWDIIRSHSSCLKDFKDVSPDFSPLIVCVLQKCLRLLNSESKTYSLSEKSTISVYVCATVKYLLQTQVDAALLSNLIQSVLSGVVDDSKDSFCEWRPLRALLLFSQTVLDQKPCRVLSHDEKASLADSSFASTLDEVKKLLRSVHRDEMPGIVKAFSSALLCTTPDVILKNFPQVMTVSQALQGVPLSFLYSIAFLEQTFLVRISKELPEMFLPGLEMAVSMTHLEGTEDGAGDRPMHSSVADENIDNMDFDEIESSDSAFSVFLKQSPFHVLFPAIVGTVLPRSLESSKIKDLLLVKISESRSDRFITHLHLVLFWFYQTRSSYRIQPAQALDQLSEICLVLVKRLFCQVLELKPDSGLSSSNLVLSSAKRKVEVAHTIFCHPIVMASLKSPLNVGNICEERYFEISSETFLSMCRQRINEIDHQVLDLLATTCDYLLSDEQNFIRKAECGVNKSVIKAFNDLVQKLLWELREKFDLCVRAENSTPLLQAFYAVHALIRFISPFKLLELARWMVGRVYVNELTIQNSSKVLSVGFGIAGGAFEILSMYLHQPAEKRQAYDLLWELKDNSYDVDLIEEIYALVCKFASEFKLDFADICLLKAINSAYRQKHTQHHNVHPLTLIMSRVTVRTPIDLISHCINRTNMTRAKTLFFLIEVSPLHLAVFGHIFLGMLNEEQCDPGLTDDQFMMLLPAALSYMNSAFVKFEKKYYKNFTKISTFYSRILLNGFLQWQSFVSGYIFEERYDTFFASSTKELYNLVDGSLLGKAIHMLRHHFALSGGSMKLEELLKLFNSIFPESAACDGILDYNLKELGFQSFDKVLNVVIRVVAKVSFSRTLLFPEGSEMESVTNEAGNNVKDISLEMESAREDLSKRLMNSLVNSWRWIVKKFPSVSDGASDGKSKECLCLYRSLEDFILRSILELTKTMREDLVQLQSIPFLEKMMKSALLYRFEDPITLKRLRNIFSLLSKGKFSHLSYLHLLVSHSQFAPTINSLSKLSSSPTGELFRAMSSILKSLIIPRPDSNEVHGKCDLKEPELHMKQLEIVKLLRVMLFNCGKETGINLSELHFLLLSSYGATLSRIDLEMYKLMRGIELIDESHSINVAGTDYLWGKAAIKVRKEQTLEQDGPHVNTDSVEAYQECQFRENLCVEPKLCASTVLYFPYQRTAAVEHLSLNNIEPDDEGINEAHSPDVGNIGRYDPVFILHFSIHCLSMGYTDPVEFAGLGLLAVAFASMSSVDLGIRKLGYETLGRFQNAFEIPPKLSVTQLNTLVQNCRKNKDVAQLKLLLTYIQNGIEEPWQRIPSVTALFAAETSLILLDPSHEHYAALSKFLMSTSRVKLKEVPVFHNFFWSSAINFRTQRLWELRLVYAGLNSDDDAQIYIRNSILETLMSFYSSPLSNNESKDLILQVVKKSVKLHKMARHLVEHCGLLSWLSSIISIVSAPLVKDGKSFSLTQLVVVAEVINSVLSSRNIVEWLQRCAFEQLMEISSHLYRLLVDGLISIEENSMLVESILQIVSTTLKISQKRKMYQPHFTLSIEGIFRIYEAVMKSNTLFATASSELGLRAILMSIPPVDIVVVDPEKLSSFLLWGTSTALMSDSKKESQPNEPGQGIKMLIEEAAQEESSVSKFLRWLIASVIRGKLYPKVDHLEPKLSRRTNYKTLQLLLEHVEKRCQESHKRFESEQTLAAVIYYLQQLLGISCRVLPSVVSALSLLLHNIPRISGSEFKKGYDKTFIESLGSRIQSPPEANPAWRWSYYQPWRDLSAEQTTDLQKIDELHACQTLLPIFSDLLGERSSDSRFLSPKDLEISGLFKWETSLVECE